MNTQVDSVQSMPPPRSDDSMQVKSRSSHMTRQAPPNCRSACAGSRRVSHGKRPSTQAKHDLFNITSRLSHVWTLKAYTPSILLCGSPSRAFSSYCSAGCLLRGLQPRAQEPRVLPLLSPAVVYLLVTGPGHRRDILCHTESLSGELARCCATPRRSTSRRTGRRP